MRREVDVAHRAGGDLHEVEPGRDERAVGREQPDPHDRVGGPRHEHLQVPFAGPGRYAGDDDVARRCRGGGNPVDAERVEAADLLVAQGRGDAALAHLHVHPEPRDRRGQRVEQEHLLTARGNRHTPPRRCLDLPRRTVERHVHLRGSGLGVGEVEPAALPDLCAAADEPEVGAGGNAGCPGQAAQVATRRTGGLHRREPRCQLVGRFADQRGAACGRRGRCLLVRRGQRDDRGSLAREAQQLRLAGPRRYAVQARRGHAHLGLRPAASNGSGQTATARTTGTGSRAGACATTADGGPASVEMPAPRASSTVTARKDRVGAVGLIASPPRGHPGRPAPVGPAVAAP